MSRSSARSAKPRPGRIRSSPPQYARCSARSTPPEAPPHANHCQHARFCRSAARMLGLDFVKANQETVERAIRDKAVDLDLDELLALDGEVRAAKTEIDRLRAERNAVSAKFKDATPEEKADLGRQAREAGARASALEAELSDKQAALRSLMLKLPGIPYEGTPVGPDESYNVVVRSVGEPPKFDFEPLDHVALIEKNGWGDLSRVTQVSGSRTYCLKGNLALLETKLMGWALT